MSKLRYVYVVSEYFYQESTVICVWSSFAGAVKSTGRKESDYSPVTGSPDVWTTAGPVGHEIEKTEILE